MKTVILDCLVSWGEGLRVEEIAAATGIPELTVYETLRASAAVEDRGELGWFFRYPSAVREAMRRGCPSCGALPGSRCRSLGLVSKKGLEMSGVHAPRKRAVVSCCPLEKPVRQ